MLKLKIKNMFDENRGLAGELAKKIGLSNATPLYKFVNDPDREMDNFNCLLALVRELFDDEKKIMGEYILTLDPNKKTARYCLEYTRLNKMDKSRKELIERMLNCSNAESKEWAKLHQIGYWGDTGMYNPHELEVMLCDVQPKTTEMIVYKGIEKLYCMYDVRNISGIESYRKTLLVHLMKIKDEVLRTIYYNRLMLIGMGVALHTNDIAKVRTYEKEDSKFFFDNSKAKYYLMLGCSYMFESYTNSLSYLLLALEYAYKTECEIRIKETQNTINFLCSYYGEKAPHLVHDSNEVSDIHEVAFNLIKTGDTKGLEILESMDLESMNNSQLGFHYFYKGLATGDVKCFFSSIKHFNLSGEKFYKFISLNELRKSGVDEFILDTMAV